MAQGLALVGADGHASVYHLLWKVPPDARAGRYEIDLRDTAAGSLHDPRAIPHICSFVVHRQLIRVSSLEIGGKYYTSGDAIACSVQLANLSNRPFAGLRVEFSERYWPWIAQQTERVGSGIVTLTGNLDLKPHLGEYASSSKCAVASGTTQPTIKQYSAVVWDHERKNVYAVAISPLVFINPPGITSPHPYSLPYVYPDLTAVNTTSYRHFRARPFGAAAIQFDTHHTQFSSGSAAGVKFTLVNPTPTAWRQVKVLTRLVGPDGREVTGQPSIPPVNLDPHAPALKQEVEFRASGPGRGIFRVEVEIAGPDGRILAWNELELGVNPLPRSVLMFCAHEDDDGTQMGFIRSLVENQVPLPHGLLHQRRCGLLRPVLSAFLRTGRSVEFWRRSHAGSARRHGTSGRAGGEHLLPGIAGRRLGQDLVRPSALQRSLSCRAAGERPCSVRGPVSRPTFPYARDAVVEATEEIIKKFQPEVIFTNHPPAEGHIDHIVNNYFVVKALQELLRAGAISPDLEVRVDRIFDPKGYPATPYHYEDHEFYVSGEAMALAQEAGWFYQSQGGNSAEGNLRTWNQLQRTEGYRKVLDWKEHEGWNETGSQLASDAAILKLLRV